MYDSLIMYVSIIIVSGFGNEWSTSSKLLTGWLTFLTFFFLSERHPTVFIIYLMALAHQRVQRLQQAG